MLSSKKISPEATTAQNRLKELRNPLNQLTGLSWEITKHNDQWVLMTDPPCRDKHQVEFVNDILVSRLMLKSEEAEYQQLEDIAEKNWSFIVISNISPEKIGRIQRTYQSLRTKRQGERQYAQAARDQLERITGVVWKNPEREECLLAPLYLLTLRHEEDVITLLADRLNTFCDEQKLERIVFHKTRVVGEKHWEVEVEKIKPVLKAYYDQSREQHQREHYRAKKIAQKLNAVLEHGLCVDVDDAVHFFDSVRLFVECDLSQQHYLRSVLCDQHLLTGPWRLREGRISFAATQVSLVKLDRYIENYAAEQQRTNKQFAEEQCRLLQVQLEQYIHLENHQLRAHVLSAVKETEERLTRQVNTLGHRLLRGLHMRLERFEATVLKRFDAQGEQLEKLQLIIQQSQEYLLTLHEQQERQFDAQKNWLEQTLVAKVSAALQPELAKGWETQIKSLLTQQFVLQEQRLQACISSSEGEWGKRLTQFQETFMQAQQVQWETYQEQLSAYLENHAESLEKTHQEMTQKKNIFVLIEETFFNYLDKDESVALEEIIHIISKTYTATGIVWDDFHAQLLTLEDGVLASKEGMKVAVHALLQQHCQQQLESQAMDCLVKTANSEPREGKKQAVNRAFFIESFERKAQESFGLIQQVSQGMQETVDNVSEQVAEVTEVFFDVFSIAIPGLSLVFKAATYGTKKYLAYRDQCFSERIELFLMNESADSLFAYFSHEIANRYEQQLTQLTTKGIENLIDRYLLPCLFTEMAKPCGEISLSTIQKKRCLLLSAENKTPLLPVKLITKQRRKTPWTAAGMMLGPAVIVDSHYYIRRDNPLRHFPWQPKPHLMYGYRVGDAEEVAQGFYELLSRMPEPVVVLADEPEWKKEMLKTGDEAADYLLAHPEELVEQDAKGNSCWLALAKRSEALVACLTRLIDAGHMQESLCLTDENERNILHIYFAENCKEREKFTTITRDLPILYDLLGRLGSVSLWDQQRDAQGWLPFEIIYQAWQKNKTIPLNMALSLWFSKSQLPSLEQLCSAYPLALVLRELSFDSPMISPLFSLYGAGRKEYLLSLLSEDNCLSEVDAEGNNLLHRIFKNNDHDFFQALILRVDLKVLVAMLGRVNSQGDTPIVAAVKLKYVDVLWCMVRHENLISQAKTSWDLLEAQRLGQHDSQIVTVLEIFPSEGSEKKSTYSALPMRMFSAMQKTSSDFTKLVAKHG